MLKKLVKGTEAVMIVKRKQCVAHNLSEHVQHSG
jgi:hypothetical protein